MTCGIGTRRAASFCFSRASIGVGLGIGALVGVADPSRALGQETVFVGRHLQAEVIVDLSAIDEAVSKNGNPDDKGGAAKTPTKQPAVTLTPPAVKASAGMPGEALIVLRPPTENSAKRKPATATVAGPTKSSPAPTAEGPATAASGPATAQQTQKAPQSTAKIASKANSAPGKTPQPAAATSGSPPATESAPPAQMAAAPPASSESPSVAPGDAALSVEFGTGAAELPVGARGDLDKIAATLKKNGDARIQLLAYAAGGDAQASQLRRLSLDRALSIRKYLIDQGITSSRIEVHALGNKFDGGTPADRVDLMIVNK